MTTLWTWLLLPVMGLYPLPPRTGDLDPPKGLLIVDGGGQASPAVKKRALDLAGGLKARIVIFPQASNLVTSGPKAEKKWREAGAENVVIVGLEDPKAAVAMVLAADLVWLSGGDQERLMKRLEGTGVIEAIRQRYHDGGIIGGSSAGAAVMSDVMIARSVDEYPKPLSDYPLMGRGLGLWPGVIVDQHFLKLRRTERLKRAMVEFPGLVGIGIDESTAAFVRGGREIEVVGNSQVTVFDPRAKEPTKPAVIQVSTGPKLKEPADLIVADPNEIRVSTLKPGMTYHLDRGIISDPVAEMR